MYTNKKSVGKTSSGSNKKTVPTIDEMVALSMKIEKELGRHFSYGDLDKAIQTGKLKV